MGGITAITGLYGAKVQADATRAATDSQVKAGREANNLLREFFYQTRADEAPYQEAGVDALPQLRDLARNYDPGPEPNLNNALPTPYAPEQFTGQIDLFRDPSFQFRLQEGQRAVERSAASKGQLQSGNTLRDLTRFGQGLASQEYGAAFQRSLATNEQRNMLGQQGYQNQLSSNNLGYERGLQDYLLNYNRFRANQGQQFNQLAALAGIGQTAVGQLNAAGQNYSGRIGENILGIGNARAAGAIGVANARNRGLEAIARGLNQDVSTATSLLGAGGFGGGGRG